MINSKTGGQMTEQYETVFYIADDASVAETLCGFICSFCGNRDYH